MPTLSKPFQVVFLALLVLLVGGLAACGGTPPPEIDGIVISTVEGRIKQLNGVLDASIGQEEKKVSIAIITSDPNANWAKNMGAESVRIMMRTNVNEDPTYAGGSKVGQGIYDYHVAVGNRHGEIIVQGVKLAEGETIFW